MNQIQEIKKCFQGIVSSRNLCRELEAAYYLEDYFPIPFPLIADFASSSYISAVNLINRKTEVAITKVSKQVIGMLNGPGSGFTFNQVLEGIIFGAFDQSKFERETFNGYRGIKIYPAQSSAFACIYVKEIQFMACTNVACQKFEIINEKGEVVHSIKTEVKAGKINCISIDRSFEASSLWIRTTNVNLLVNSTHLKFKPSGCCTTSTGNCIKAAGYDGFNTYTNETFGFVVEVELRCSEDKLTCWLAPRLGLAIVHQLMIELLEELIAPNGRFTLIKIKGDQNGWAKETIATNYDLVEKYIKTEIAGVAQMLKGQSGPCACVSCIGNRVIGRMP